MIPFADGTALGPLVRACSASACAATSQKGLDEGATLVTGGADAPEGLDTGLLRAADGVLQRHAPT